MPTLLWAFACQNLITDKTSGLVSAINILEQFSLPTEAFPGETEPNMVTINPLINLVMLLSWEWPDHTADDSASINVAFHTPRDKSAILVESGTLNSEGKRRTRLAIGVGSLPIDVPGTYVFQIAVNDQTVFRLPIDILKNEKKS